ncbi:MAG TPA: cache domain-containing protein, partial [Anaerolineales bacterium]|nr:cache domain-containing protein [Anaerolineales bacterium]
MNKFSSSFLKNLPSPESRRVFIITLIAFILGLAANLISTRASDSQNVLMTYWIWRSLAFLGLPILWLCWKGNVRLAGWLLISVFMASMATSVVLVSGLGVLAGGSIIFLGVVLAILMKMSNEDIVRVTFVSLVLGLPVILYDYYGPIRPPVPSETRQGLTIFFVVDLIAYFLLAYRNYSIFPLRYKLISALTLAALIPLSINIYLNIRGTSENLLQNANTQLITAASETASALDAFIRNGLDNVRTMSQFHGLSDFLLLPADQRVGSELETAIYLDLRAIANQNQTFISSVGVMDLNGKNIADTDFTQIGEVEADKAYFIETLASALPYVSTVQDDEGELSLYFSAPIRDSTGQNLGVLRVRYNAAILQAILVKSTRNIETEGVVLDLLDENNIFLGITDEPDEILHTVSTFSPEKFAQLQEEGRLPEDGTPESLSLEQDDLAEALANASQTPTFALSSEGEQAAVMGLETRPWIVLAGQPEEIFLAPLNTLYRTSTVIAIVIIVLSVISALYGTRLISAPVVN